MTLDLEKVRGRWSAAHHDEGLVRSLSHDEAHAALVDAVGDIDALTTEVERLRLTIRTKELLARASFGPAAIARAKAIEEAVAITAKVASQYRAQEHGGGLHDARAAVAEHVGTRLAELL